MFYDGNENGACYPRKSGTSPLWADGVAHFPNEAASCAALQSVNKGGWTDWVYHVRPDNRGSNDGGTGFIELWKREDSGPWVEVVDIRPGQVTRGGMTFNHGIGYGPGSKGYGPKAGMYLAKEQVWGLKKNRILYIANIKIADEKAKFADLAPDFTPESDVPPRPPTLVTEN
jgi:hypothetical protein